MLCTQTLSWNHFAVFKCCSVYQPSQEKVLFSYCNKWIFRKYKADVIMLQETKKPWISRQCFRSFCEGRNKDWIYTPSFGSAGGMLIEWKTDLLKLDAVEYRPFSLSSKFLECNSEFSRLNSCIYGPASNNGKEEFWWN